MTDAPVDNNGRGEAFSPTDLLATAYGSCMLTIAGIYCDKHGVEMKGAEVGVEKIMLADPRRVGKLVIVLDFSVNEWTEDVQKRVKAAALACPVAKSVSADMELDITFKF